MMIIIIIIIKCFQMHNKNDIIIMIFLEKHNNDNYRLYGFNGISTLDGYSIPNPVFIYIYIYILTQTAH